MLLPPPLSTGYRRRRVGHGLSGLRRVIGRPQSPPPVSAPSHRAEEAVPLRAAAPPVHREIKTGSVRLVDAAQLGD